jgi:integrase
LHLVEQFFRNQPKGDDARLFLKLPPYRRINTFSQEPLGRIAPSTGFRKRNRWIDAESQQLLFASEPVGKAITAGKPIAANRVQALISSIFSFGIDAGLVKANPCTRLRKRGQETVKTRTLSDEEIQKFWRNVMLPPVSPPVGLALRLVLVLGCRPGEIAGMARAEIEFDRLGAPASWTIPASRSKNRKMHYVPFPPLARDLVAEALKLSGSSEFVFASPTSDGPIAGHALSVAMARLNKSQQNPPTPHDLRRTCATRLSAAGVPAEDVSAILNHVRVGVTGRHYDHYQRADEKRIALQRWSTILAGIIEPQAPNVIALWR